MGNCRKIPITLIDRSCDLRDAASYLSLAPASLRRLVQAGELRVIIMSDSGHAPFLLDVRDLDQWVERSKRTL